VGSQTFASASNPHLDHRVRDILQQLRHVGDGRRRPADDAAYNWAPVSWVLAGI
jgi:hypothetical protein